jgi:inorganic pyrophosphatase
MLYALPLSGFAALRDRRCASICPLLYALCPLLYAPYLCLMSSPYTLHPWHGISPGVKSPSVITAYIEITPSDTVKYELDKESGLLKVDRPQQYSNVVPALYGFIPRTYCHDQIAALCMQKTGMTGIKGDGDPLDILVLTEHRIAQGNILVQAKPIGGFRMIDKHEADDKIIAVLLQDSMYNHYEDMSQLPAGIISRLKHYFLTYKQSPEGAQPVEIPDAYGRDEAHAIIRAAMKDYDVNYGRG